MGGGWGGGKGRKQMGALIELPIPQRGEWMGWISEIAVTDFALTLESGASRLVREILGESPSAILGALSLLALYTATETPDAKGRIAIDEATVSRCFGSASQDDIFAFTRHLANRNRKEALSRLQALFEGGMDAFYILAMIRRHFRILIALSTLDRRLPAAERAKKAGAPPYFLGEYDTQLKGYTPAHLVAAHHGLARVDQRLKSEKLEPLLLMSEWMLSSIFEMV